MKAVKYILLWSVFLLALLAACKDSGKKETMAVTDPVEQAESLAMEAFEAFAEEKGATVYLQHQKEDFEKMPKAPNYLN